MIEPDTNSLAVFDTEATQVETDLSGDDFIALCGNTGWRILWWERSRECGCQWRVKAVRVTTPEPRQARLPYAD